MILPDANFDGVPDVAESISDTFDDDSKKKELNHDFFNLRRSTHTRIHYLYDYSHPKMLS